MKLLMVFPNNVKRVGGFTIIELIVVIVVIAILATITIVGYNVIRTDAYNTGVQADLRNFAGRIASFEAKNATYPRSADDIKTLGAAISSSASFDTSGNAFLYCSNASGREYRIIAKAKSGKTFIAGPTTPPQEAAGNPLAGDGSSACGSVGVSGGWSDWIHSKARTTNNGWMDGVTAN